MKYHVRLNDGKDHTQGGKDVIGGPWFTNHRGERTYVLLVTPTKGGPSWEGGYVVWYDEIGGARCTQCQAQLVAMRKDCPHAAAVTRAIKRSKVLLPNDE